MEKDGHKEQETVPFLCKETDDHASLQQHHSDETGIGQSRTGDKEGINMRQGAGGILQHELRLVRLDDFDAHGKIVKVPGDNSLVKEGIRIDKQAEIPGAIPDQGEI